MTKVLLVSLVCRHSSLAPNSMPAVWAMLIRGFHRLVSLLLSQTVLDMVVSLARKLWMARSIWMKGDITIATGVLS